MSATELRITLLVAAIIIVAVMYVWYRANSKDGFSNDISNRDDNFEKDLKNIPQFDQQDDGELLPDDLRSEFQNVSQELRQETIAKRIQESKSEPRETVASKVAAATSSEMLVIFHVVARQGEKFTGPMITRMMAELELEYGELGIYHYHVERLNKKHSMYCVANMVKPGNFDLNAMEGFTTRGLTMIMQLPGPEDGLKAFNIMVEHAQRLSAYLNGDLLDEDRNPLTKQTISLYKERVQLFSLRAGNKAASA